MRAMKIGDRVARLGQVGTAIAFKDGKVLLSFYADGSQRWYDLSESEKGGIRPKK